MWGACRDVLNTSAAAYPGRAASFYTRRSRLEDGVPVVTAGPYAETTEVLACYWTVACGGFDRAAAIAAVVAGHQPHATPPGM